MRMAGWTGALLAGALLAGAPAASAATPTTAQSRAMISDYARLLMIEHDAPEAFHRYYGAHLIQHDPWIGDGAGGDDDFLSARRKREPAKYDSTAAYVNVIHNVLADGDLVALKSHVFTSVGDAGRIFVDIWRVANGKFVEHWDVIQPITPELVQSGAVGCGKGETYAAAKALPKSVTAPACGAPDRHTNGAASRKLVLDYMAMGEQPGQAQAAVRKYVAADFVQHSGHIAPGRQGLIDYLGAHGAERAADRRTSHIARTMADGDMVLVHRRVTSTSDPRGTAYLDLFRVAHGKVAEHWDVIQPIPAFSVSGRSQVDGPLEPRRHKGPPDGPG